MLRSKSACALVVAALVSLSVASQASAQGGGRGGGRTTGTNAGGRQAFDPAAFRQQAADRMKEQMGASDDEWKVLQPKIDKLQTLSRDLRGGGMGGGMMGGATGGRGNRGTPAGDTATPATPATPAATDNQSEVQKKTADLQKILANKEAKPEEIKTALTALLDARAAATKNLEAAQKDIRDVLTARQEAVLVIMGLMGRP